MHARSHVHRASGALFVALLLATGLGTAPAAAQASVTIQGVVWLDSDRNGVRAQSESGIEQVTVRLRTATASGQPGSILSSMVTAVGGAYTFAIDRDETDPPAHYLVEVLPGDLIFTSQGVGADDTVDSDFGDDGFSELITAANGDSIDDVDAGLMLALPSIAGTVWSDDGHDLDGIRQSDEGGFSNVQVTLYRQNSANQTFSEVDSQTTGADGGYAFAELASGTYRVGATLPGTLFQFTLQDQGTDDSVDSDVATTTGQSAGVNVAPGDVVDIDIGIADIPTGSISNLVWLDSNRDGVQTAREPGIPNVTVVLYDSNNTEIGQTTTDVTGVYVFGRLPAGTYSLNFDAPAAYLPTAQDVGTNEAIDSDIDSDGNTGQVVLGRNETNHSVDAGWVLAPTASIGDRVWIDGDADGIQDATETGAPGVTVTLWTADANNNPDTVVGTTSSGSAGSYSFTEVPAGTYVVEFDAPAGSELTASKQGSHPGIDSDPDASTGFTGPIVVVDGAAINHIDAGLLPPEFGSIGDRVWNDTDQDGVQDAGEGGIPGVTVRLWTDDDGNPGTVQRTTTTNASGLYSFDSLVLGQYHVQVIPPPGTEFTSAESGSDDRFDSDIDPATGFATLYLQEGVHTQDVDAGLIPERAAVSGRAWDDIDSNGLQGAGEPGVADLSIGLWSATTSGDHVRFIGLTKTDANGNYTFDDLDAGTYLLEFAAPANREFTVRYASTQPTLDSDVDANGVTEAFTLGVGEHDDTIDAGLLPAAMSNLQGVVWTDLDGDGRREAGEPVESGHTVVIYQVDSDGNIVDGQTPTVLTTDSSGTWSTSVVADYYRVLVFSGVAGLTTPNVGSDVGDSDVSDGEGDLGFSPPLDLRGGTSATVDAGLLPEALINGRVWLDLDRDGVRANDEPDEPNVTVALLDGSGAIVATAVTDASGRYQLYGMPADTYRVRFSLPTQRQFTLRHQGPDATDSHPDPVSGITASTNVTGIVDGIDAGLTRAPASGDVNCDGRASITDALWIAQYEVGNRNDAECPHAGSSDSLVSLSVADTNADGSVTIGDALVIAQCIVGVPNVFCPSD